MSDISNRTIVALLAVALVVSVAGTMYSVSELGQVSMVFRTVSGLADAGEGNVTLNLSGTVGLQVIRDQANVGQGHVLSGEDECIFTTGGDTTPQGFSVNSTSNLIYPPGINNQNTDNGKCGGPGFNSSAFRKGGLHVLENTGNVDIDVSVEIIGVTGAAGPSANACAFLTGYGDNDGSDGCEQGGDSTRSDVNVTMGVYTISAAQSNNANVDSADDSLPTDVTDTAHSVDSPDGGELLGIKNVNSSKQTIAKKMQWENHKDELGVGFSFVIPSDASPGLREIELRYTAQGN